MSANETKLSPLKSTHDLRLACDQCCIKQGEITYKLKSVQHRCGHSLLLCRVKDSSIWRPITRRPTFPNPSHYEVCHFYREGFGCTQHKNRCSFARSKEEAAVWTFEKQHRVDHVLLCHLIAQSERVSDPPDSSDPLATLLETLDLKAGCDLCCTRRKEITYTIQTVGHRCQRNLLLAKSKASQLWRPVSDRPTLGHFGKGVFYQECLYFAEDSGCTVHGQTCTFARSFEEATVWNHVRDRDLDRDQLLKLVVESEPTLLTPERAAESILLQFPGEFVELCTDCFLEKKLTNKRWNNTCAADAAHTWEPVLVHHLSDSSGKHIYSQVRPLPSNRQFKFCSHVRQGKPCWHPAGHCGSAQSEVEMSVWKVEDSGLYVRPQLLQMSQAQQTKHGQGNMYCKVCLLVLSSPESFFKHCSSLEHAQLLSEDTTTRWRGRQPPHGQRADFWLCERPETCEYGSRCPKAHSVEELQEWMMRAVEEKEIRFNIEAQGLMCYNEKLLEEYRNSNNEVYVMSEQVDDVSVSCVEELTMQCQQIDETLQWHFQVETERQLVHVALLKQEPGASFSLGETTSMPCIYSSGKVFVTGDMTYDVTVSFTSINPGLYEQWLVLDFNMRPVLLKKLRVKVSQISLEEAEEPAASQEFAFQTAGRWHRGNMVIIPCSTRTEEQEALLKEYKPPQMNFQYKSSSNNQTSLNPENYRERMHKFLYDEEQAEDQIVSRLNVRGEITTMDSLMSSKFLNIPAPPGQLFCAVSIPCNLTPDTPEGQVLKQSIQSGLIAPMWSDGGHPKVYEATILHDHTNEKKMYLQLSKKCCSDLSLKSNESHRMEVQFQLSRLSFCTMHKAVDLLPDTKRVLPELKNCKVPVSSIIHEKLNPKQQSAINFITGNSIVPKNVAPLLIYGPFGTGKTFTLATAARELCKQPHNKVLICTYTNSSADLYVSQHFHPFITDSKTRPIRIKANKHGKALFATDAITLKYCLLSEDRRYFLPPTRASIDRYNIVITTTSMARHFHELKLPAGYFTHILIDEASQMLECEALMALGLAGPDTRVVLAGDHMQMGPKLFSVDDHHRSNQTLLTRLFHYYQGQKCEAAHSSRVIFSENYRSTLEIVEFISTYFYLGKNDIIRAVGNIPAPANGHALRFSHVRGECLLDTVSMSWYNKEEVAKVVEEVGGILKQWPPSWGRKDLSSICVLSEGNQVWRIRSALSKRGFPEVHVENLANVQGKQFRTVIITAIHTRDSLKTSHLAGLELFNDARVLNTAMTRAQSQVIVVGDAAALCCFGKCSAVWKAYINYCVSNNSVAPKHFTKDFFERDLMETARFQKSEHEGESNSLSDAILQEMKDEYEQLEQEYSSDEEELDRNQINHFKIRPSHSDAYDDEHHEESSGKQPDIFTQGKIFRESFNKGYVIPFDNPTRRIHIEGRANMGHVFTGDEVVLEESRVAGITKEDESARTLVCFLEDEDHSQQRQSSDSKFVRRMMIPITKSEPKICILITKKRRNFMPIWNTNYGQRTPVDLVRMDEKLRQNNVFLVQVIGWKERYHYPLGHVIAVIPVGQSLTDGLRILNEEFKVAYTECMPDMVIFERDEDQTHRVNRCDVLTFTVDSETTENLDDAISLREVGDQYELGIHIADVASCVHPGDEIDKHAKHCGTSYFPRGQKPIHMFPEELRTEHLSLLEGRERRVVSLMIKVEKETNEIVGESEFELSLIKSDKKLSFKTAEQEITQRLGDSPKFDTVEDCISVAYHFAKAQRKKRLKDWAYYQPCEKKIPGKRKAYLMIEELNVLYNTYASKTLIGSDKTKNCTPLRCQGKPDPEMIKELKKNFGGLIPLSFAVRHRVSNDGQVQSCGNFPIVAEVWTGIQSAAEAGDVDKMVDIIAADDIHPLLQPVISQFRRCSSGTFVVPFGDDRATVGHYSLRVPCYTQASSPIWRYMDIVLQRLLHSFICNKGTQYTGKDIASLCSDFEQNLQKAKKYEQKFEQVFYAVSMKKQSAAKLAFVVSGDSSRDGFTVSFPFNKNVFTESLIIMYKDLQLWDQPAYDEKGHCIRLQWKRRIYPADDTQIYDEFKIPDCGPCVELPLKVWVETIIALDDENWDLAKDCIKKASPKKLVKDSSVPQPSEIHRSESDAGSSKEEEVLEEQSGHEVDINFELKAGDTLQIQMTSELKRGYHMPAVQLLHIQPKFEICVEHVHSPITCFSKSADDPTKIYYRNPEEYAKIWRPLCEMESAANAVNEEDSIIIENLEISFKQERRGTLTGSFFLSVTQLENWAIECNLSKCLLCIRKRGLPLTSIPEHSAMVDPKEFTWVAHGVTRPAEKQKKTMSEGSKVEFYINHLSMEPPPDCIFKKNTSFTVEIIPKTLPDVRKEDAVNNITIACELVQTIAVGLFPKEAQTRRSFRGTEVSNGLPSLNSSQRVAVDKALNNPFTLIQGPPGTGKTVVGVHLVNYFFELNTQNPRISIDPEDQGKKQVILYCGPSNKSVDVVAGKLLKHLVRFKDKLKPLRVYGRQVEINDFPCPDGPLQFPRSTVRQGRVKEELRSITLHFRIREDQNPFAVRIKALDKRIEHAHRTKKKSDQLTDQEVKEYKQLLRDARKYELERHEVLLCTCTQSSSPILVGTVSARQVLIDECGMATEPQALIPLVCNKPEQIVLIGDHKQLRPVVRDTHVKKLGMAKSLFERFYTMPESKAVMLDTQYRMHRDICEFPSKEYYNGKLKTGVEPPSSILRVKNKPMTIVFGDCKGKTVSLIVNTVKGNENSKANQEERKKVIAIAGMMVKNAKIQQKDIVILSPYNAQVTEIKEELKKKSLGQILVTTITKSQGSEWRYVIISTVCSLPSKDIPREQDGAWLSKNLGFVGDPNQINVAITRAKEGLCIIGDQELLNCSRSWRKLLNHYKTVSATTEADKITAM
ncbi:helicase with zinc finger domain 2 [Xyrichtys novacula]|uniref:Helicase with zinc finger domain 2 n=1 Tax=Xyrichtys novacula TaxID=13765 RepID=A0AAV1EQ08_XYRNO|nr:helicase with zinc finger domain 2 [Xyrichtys novacula]